MHCAASLIGIRGGAEAREKKAKRKVPPRLELRSSESESDVLTTTLWNPDYLG